MTEEKKCSTCYYYMNEAYCVERDFYPRITYGCNSWKSDKLGQEEDKKMRK